MSFKKVPCSQCRRSVLALKEEAKPLCQYCQERSADKGVKILWAPIQRIKEKITG